MDPTQLLALPVAEILAGPPSVARVFLARGMACPGCPFAPFETLTDVARAYGADANALAAALVEAGAGASSSGEAVP